MFYGLETPAEAFAEITSEELYGCEFMLNLSDNLGRISLPMTGRHNVYQCNGRGGVRVRAGNPHRGDCGRIERHETRAGQAGARG